MGIRGIRKSVFQSAARCGGYYTSPDRTQSIRYVGETMVVFMAFENLMSAREFAEDLEKLNDFRAQMADVGEAEPYGGVLSHKRAVYSKHYVSTDSSSPPASVTARSDSTVASALVPSFGIMHYQRLEPLQIIGGAGFERCHIKHKKYCTDTENENENIFFSLSFQFHKQFDGRGGSDVPSVRISVHQICPTLVEVETATSGKEDRYRVDLLVEFRSKEAFDGFMGVLKEGSEQLDHCTRWKSFVYVTDAVLFKAYVDFKYAQTSEDWE